MVCYSLSAMSSEIWNSGSSASAEQPADDSKYSSAAQPASLCLFARLPPEIWRQLGRRASCIIETAQIMFQMWAAHDANSTCFAVLHGLLELTDLSETLQCCAASC